MPKIDKKILVVEDEATMREIVVHKLASSGFKVYEAGDGKEATQVWEKERPDIVLLDLMLPEMDGFQVLESMRKHQEHVIANTPVIVLSNLFRKEDLAKTKQLKIDDFLVKAYHTTEEILDRVNDILQRK